MGIMELSLLRTFAPGSESTMVWNFRSLELSLPGAKFQELSLPHQVTFGGGDSRVVASRTSKQEGPGSIPGGRKEV